MPSDQPARFILSDTHKAQLMSSGISGAVVAARGYWTEHVKVELKKLGFSPSQQQVPALVLPLWNLGGEVTLHQIRPNEPRLKKGRPVKYEIPAGAKKIIDVPPLAREKVLQGSSPLFITEGVKKADAAVSKGLCCVALLDVWAWQNQEKFWDQVPLTRRAVYIAFDSDICTNKSVQLAAAQLKVFLQERHADVQFIILPGQDTGNKVGLDDFLASGQGEQELLRFACADLPFKAAKSVGAEGPARYRCGPGGIFREIEGKDGEVSLEQLTNFPARIAAELLVTDGMDSHREFEIEATVGGRVQTESVRADKFAVMWWVEEKLGAEAIVFPGPWKRDNARAAIQALSIPIPQTTAYTHLGWVIHEGKRYFAHGGGLIGADLEAEQPEGGDDRDAVKSEASKDLAPPVPIVPILRNDVVPQDVCVQPEDLEAGSRPLRPAALRRRLACPVGSGRLQPLPRRQDRQLQVRGGGVGPAALRAGDEAAQAAGELELNSERQPRPDVQGEGCAADDGRLARPRLQERRGAGEPGRGHNPPSPRQPQRPGPLQPGGNGKSRQAATLLPHRDRRGHPGRQLPQRPLPGPPARQGGNQCAKLTGCQTDAAEGLYAEATAAYLRWLIPDYEATVEEMELRKRELRGHFAGRCLHPRTAEIAADLLAAFEVFLNFAEDVGAIDEQEFGRYFDRLGAALEECIHTQNTQIKEQEPVEQFLQYVASALLCGRAHLAGINSGPPEDTGHGLLNTWGWEEREEARPEAPEQGKTDSKEGAPEAAPPPRPVVKRWPKGECIGWMDGGNVYLNSKSVLAVAQKMARDCGQYLAIGSKSLGKLLDEGDHLESKGKPGSDHPYTIKLTAQGGRHPVYHVRAFSLIKPAWWNPERESANFEDLLG